MISAIGFNNINQYKPLNRVQNKQYYSLKPLERDTVSFTSKNLFDLPPMELSKKIIASIEDENRIGFGSEGEVFKIRDTDYCVKLPKGESILGLGMWKTNINSQDKINHVVAKSYNGATIMKYIEGKPLRWVKPDKIYDLPKSSYKSFMKQLQNAYDECLKFDNAPSNIIYNSKDKSFTLIDFREPNPDVDLEFNPLSTIFTALQNYTHTPEDKADARKLTGKLLDIALDELTSEKEPEIEISKEDVFKLFGELRISQSFEEPKQMFFLREAFSDIFRLKDMEKTDDNNKKFNGNVKVARAIIKQVLSD